MSVRGVRGAVQVTHNEPEEILRATRKLLEAMLEANEALRPDDLASVLFTATGDLNAAYPAQAAREIGWTRVPLMCTQELPVPNGLERVVRVLMHWNTDLGQDAIRHVYLGETSRLRPDLAGPGKQEHRT